MDGTAAIGNATTWATANHVHPSDTSKLNLSGGTLTGALTPQTTGGLVGTTLGDNANAGSVGEIISSVVASPGVTLTTAAAANVTSISLTPGDWDVSGELWVAVGAGGATFIDAQISATSGGLALNAINAARAGLYVAFSATGTNTFALRPCRVSLSATTTYYLVAYMAFPSGTCTAYGNIIARRAR